VTSLADILSIADDAWRAHAACHGADPAVFDGNNDADELEALSYCQRCPVILDCLDWVRHDRRFSGVAGGRMWARKRDQ
jgi:hypothetical protein